MGDYNLEWSPEPKNSRCSEHKDHGEKSLLTPPPSGHREDEFDQLAIRIPQPGSSQPECVDTPTGPRINSDILFVSSDVAYFHAHSPVILAASRNLFNHTLPDPSLRDAGKQKSRDEGYFGASPLFAVPETSMIFNIIIHAIYRVSCAHYHPSLDDLTEAVGALQKYGIEPSALITPTSALFNQLLSHAPDRAFDIYAFASQHNLHDLAVSASAYLRAFPLCDITDEMTQRVAAVYVKKLFFMHFGRVEALKRLLFPPPYPHDASSVCGPEHKDAVNRAWTMAAVQLALNVRVDLTESDLRAAFFTVESDLTCKLCRAAVADRLDILTLGWSRVKGTI
ncbi:hypothetical protein FIBSPDRAFT_967658 [Athelia psychrophila]|uniref:BTB domain-containing protein n=1 Tax=Athelia psychrophila TaxID=1759441 RepID=A0A167VGE5_9AGAM|nr:hypothetical protein FIBSPDRAFT_967658 [Fibularhizoctonia sp. CBS 109695]